jgi:5'-nucleotidase
VTVVATEKYRVTANSFLADGGDQLYEFTRGADRVGGPQDIDALAAYFAAHPSVSPSEAARIKLSQPTNP